eukprot:337623-Rhodomonas_salina.1
MVLTCLGGCRRCDQRRAPAQGGRILRLGFVSPCIFSLTLLLFSLRAPRSIDLLCGPRLAIWCASVGRPQTEMGERARAWGTDAVYVLQTWLEAKGLRVHVLPTAVDEELAPEEVEAVLLNSLLFIALIDDAWVEDESE